MNPETSAQSGQRIAHQEKPPAEPEAAKSLWDNLRAPGFWVVIVLLVLLLIAGVLIFLPFWGPLFLAAVTTTLLYPAYTYVLRLVGERRRGLASFITCILFIAVILIPLSWLSFNVWLEAKGAIQAEARELVQVIDGLDRYASVDEFLRKHPMLQGARAWLRGELVTLAERPPLPKPGPQPSALEIQRDAPTVAPEPPASEPGKASGTGSIPVPGQVSGAAGTASGPATGGTSTGSDSAFSIENLLKRAQNLARLTTGLLSGVFGFGFKVFLMFFLMFYFFRDGPQILASLRRGIPLDQEYQEKVVRSFQSVSQSMIKGTFLTALIQGTVAGITFFFLDYSAFFWGAVTAVCSLVPVLGTGLVTIPFTIVFLLNQEWLHAGVMAGVAAVIAAMDNFLRPLLIQGELHLHPVWILLSVLGGMGIFGPLGLVLGPMVVILIRTLLALLGEGDGAAAPAPAPPPQQSR